MLSGKIQPDMTTLITTGVNLVILSGVTFWLNNKVSKVSTRVDEIEKKMEAFEKTFEMYGRALSAHESILRGNIPPPPPQDDRRPPPQQDDRRVPKTGSKNRESRDQRREPNSNTSKNVEYQTPVNRNSPGVSEVPQSSRFNEPQFTPVPQYRDQQDNEDEEQLPEPDPDELDAELRRAMEEEDEVNEVQINVARKLKKKIGRRSLR